ncbi:MAG: RdgB/HAM1 family non-canonical purine NTP pyrophosphatase [Candidatus Nanopelagicales bacterium]
MTARVVLATRNEGKVGELRRILTEAGLDVELVGAAAFAALPEIAETGATFAANALLKARVVAAYTGLPAVADDSGLCVDALNGMPGILSARWAGGRDDEANLDLVLAQLSDTADERRGAHFFCAAAVAMPSGHHGQDGQCRVVEGTIDGMLLRARRGTGGFGYDPIFLPYGSARTTAELDAAEKDVISHRGKAFRALAPVLADLLAEQSARPVAD